MPIVSFDDKRAEGFFVSGKIPKGTGWTNAATVVKRKLDLVHYAARLADLKSPPGNQLEALAGELKGWHSIRVNDQSRLVFIWRENAAHRVSVIDYH